MCDDRNTSYRRPRDYVDRGLGAGRNLRDLFITEPSGAAGYYGEIYCENGRFRSDLHGA